AMAAFGGVFPTITPAAPPSANATAAKSTATICDTCAANSASVLQCHRPFAMFRYGIRRIKTRQSATRNESLDAEGLHINAHQWRCEGRNTSWWSRFSLVPDLDL